MIFRHLFIKKYQMAFVGLAGLAMTACGTYQQVSYYDNDGIYNTGSVMRVATHESAPARAQEQHNQNDFYKDYFGERAQELDQVLEGEIFTDIDSYTSLDSLSVAQDSLLGNPADYLAYENEYQQYPAWGDRGGNVSVNIYGGNIGMGWNDPWLWNGWGYNAWYRPWRSFGWNGWGWGYGGFYDPWFGNGWIGNGWYGYGFAPFYGNYYGYPYRNWGYPNFGFRNYAYGYTRGRRGFSTNSQNPRGSRYASTTNGTAYRLNSGRSNATNNARFSSTRSQQSRSNTEAAIRNQTYRNLRSSRSTSPYYSGSQSYRSSISGNRNQAAPTGRYQIRSSGSSYSRSANSGYRNSSSTNRSSSGNSYRSSGSSNRSSSSGYRSSGSSSRSSGGNFSSGSSGRSSGGSTRSSGGGGSSRSSGGRSGGGRGN